MTERLVRPNWDAYMKGFAAAASVRSTCRRRQVGAAIFGPDNRVISTGYNGAPAGQPDCLQGACPRGLRSYDEIAADSDYTTGDGFCIANGHHAEDNAIDDALKKLGAIPPGSTIAITHKPCPGCAERIAAQPTLERTIY